MKRTLPLLRRYLTALSFLLVLHPACSAQDSEPSKVDQAPPTPKESSSELRKNRIRNDDLNGRTTIRYFFDFPDDLTCFSLGGIFEFDAHGWVTFTYPHVIAPNIGLGSIEKDNRRVLTFAKGNCRIQLFVSKEVLDGDRWIRLDTH